MTTYSESDLANQTLLTTGLIETNGTLSAEDYTAATTSNRSVINMLNALGIPVWNGSEISVPEEYFVELAMRCSLPFQLRWGQINMQQYLGMVDECERRLTLLAAPRGATPLLSATNESSQRRRAGVYSWSIG
jgi:hypothetical protein